MKMRIAAGVVAVALAFVAGGYVFDWLQHRPIVGVVSTPDHDEAGIGLVSRDRDEQAMRDAKTVEEFKKATGMSPDTGAPSPSAWRP